MTRDSSLTSDILTESPNHLTPGDQLSLTSAPSPTGYRDYKPPAELLNSGYHSSPRRDNTREEAETHKVRVPFYLYFCFISEKLREVRAARGKNTNTRSKREGRVSAVERDFWLIDSRSQSVIPLLGWTPSGIMIVKCQGRPPQPLFIFIFLPQFSLNFPPSYLFSRLTLPYTSPLHWTSDIISSGLCAGKVRHTQTLMFFNFLHFSFLNFPALLIFIEWGWLKKVGNKIIG